MASLNVERLSLTRAYHAVSEALQRYIVSGGLKPGDPLPTEFELCEMFGVNRSTVREGIRQLEAEGLVTRESRKRLVVSIPGSGNLAPQVTRALVMNQVTFRDLLLVAMQLEPLAAELAAQRATAEHVAGMEANVAGLAAAIESNGDSIDFDLEFHGLLARCSENQVLLLSREPVSLLLFRTYEEIRPEIAQAQRRNLEAHRKILDAVRHGDTAGARDWMERHLRDFELGWRLAGRQMDEPIHPSTSL